MVTKQSSILVLDPSHELRFRGPFTQVVTADLVLRNPSGQRLCFKVKTTAPKQYCVRPNGGFVEPSQSVKVQVILQPFNYDPAEKNRHKFLVQSIVCPENCDNQDQLWKDTPVDQIMDSKLRCVFELPGDAQSTKPVSGQTAIKREPGTSRDTSQNRADESRYSQAANSSSRDDGKSGRTKKLPEVNIILAILIALIAAAAGVVIGKFAL